MTEPLTPELFSAQLIENDKNDKTYHPSWRQTSTLAETCPFCFSNIEGALSYMIFIVPPTIGGTEGDENVVRTCIRCSKLKAMRDPLGVSSLPALSPNLLARRHQALLHGRNHLTHLRPYVPHKELEAALVERFSHPRIRCFASAQERCFIGWLKKSGKPSAYSNAAGILRMGFNATVHEEGQALVFELDPSRFYDATWALIELNALVLPVGASQLVLDDYDWRRCWVDTYDRLSDNRRRRSTEQTARPHPAKALSTNPATVRSRRRKSRKEAVSLQQEKDLRLSRAMFTAYRNFTNPEHRMYSQKPSWDELQAMYEEACLLAMDKTYRRREKQKHLFWKPNS